MCAGAAGKVRGCIQFWITKWLASTHHHTVAPDVPTTTQWRLTYSLVQIRSAVALSNFIHGLLLLLSFFFLSHPGPVFYSCFQLMDSLLLCLPLLLPSISFLSVYFLPLLHWSSFISQLFLTCFYFYWALHSPASLPLLYPLWLATVDEHSLPTQFSDPVFSAYRIQ